MIRVAAVAGGVLAVRLAAGEGGATPSAESAPGNQPPRATATASPAYPSSLRTSGLRGEVVVEFVVDREGRVTNATVVQSLNPAFDEPALEAIRRWKFEPGRREGVAVNTKMRQTISFQNTRMANGGESGLVVRTKGDLAGLPPEFRYDVAPKPRGVVRPVYPYALLRDEVEGKAQVRFVVAADGTVAFVAVNSADRPEFGAALQAALEGFAFEPAQQGGKPVQALLTFEQKFSAYDRDGVITHDDRTLLAVERKHPERIVGADRLDAKLQLVSSRAPLFPLALKGRVAQGEAVVEFLVDEAGRARLPRVASASDPAFGWAAVQALAAWRFAPPKSGGKAVIIRVRVPFRFTGPPPAP